MIRYLQFGDMNLKEKQKKNKQTCKRMTSKTKWNKRIDLKFDSNKL